MIMKTREFSEFPSIADHLINYPGQSQNCRLISVENVLSKFPTSENRRVEFLTELFVEFREFSVDFRYLNRTFDSISMLWTWNPWLEFFLVGKKKKILRVYFRRVVRPLHPIKIINAFMFSLL
jgi:hypothetical protein